MINQQVFTNVGLAELSAAEAGGTLNITKIVVGSGTATADADLYPLVALIDWQADVTLTRRTDLGNGSIIISGALNETTMPSGPPFSLRELGVMASVGAGPEQLYTVSNVYTDTPDTVTPGGTSTHAFDITIVVGRGTTVNITIGDDTSVDCQNIPTDVTVGPGIYALRVGNVFEFKRLVQGVRMTLTDSSDRITIARKSVETLSLQVYVPASHPDCPSPEFGFNHIDDALAYLNSYLIAPAALGVVNIYKGTFTLTSAVNINHIDASRIWINGYVKQVKNITAITWLDATHKRVTVDDATDLAIGMYVYVRNSDGAWSGGCVITAIAGLVITCTIEKRDTRAAYTTANVLAGATLAYCPSVIAAPDSNTPAFICPRGVYRMQGLTIVGGGSAIWALGSVTNLVDVMVFGADIGVRVERGASLNVAGDCVMTQCRLGLDGWGVYANQNAVQQDVPVPVKLYLNANTIGAHLHSAELASLDPTQTIDTLFLAHNGMGVQAINGASCVAGHIRCSVNDVGILASIFSSVGVGTVGGPRSFFDSNALDLQALGKSYIQFYKLGAASPSCDPTAETSNNQDSLIHLI